LRRRCRAFARAPTATLRRTGCLAKGARRRRPASRKDADPRRHEEYARENGSIGLTTMRDHHAKVRGETVRFEFRARAVSSTPSISATRVSRKS